MERTRDGPSSYEPFKHEQVPEPYDPEKPLVPPPSSSAGAASNIHDLKHTSAARRLKSRAGPNYTRIALRAVAFAFAVSILALQSKSIFIYYDTRRDSTRNATTGLQTKLWAYIHVSPTFLMFGASVYAAVVHFFALATLFACCRSMRESLWHIWSVYLSSAVLVAIWLVSTIYFKVTDYQGDNKNHWDLWSWTCHSKGQKSADVPWAAMCTENTYTFYASIIVLLLEVAGLALFVISQRGLKANSLSSFNVYQRFQTARTGYRLF